MPNLNLVRYHSLSVRAAKVCRGDSRDLEPVGNTPAGYTLCWAVPGNGRQLRFISPAKHERQSCILVTLGPHNGVDQEGDGRRLWRCFRPLKTGSRRKNSPGDLYGYECHR